MNGGVWVYAEEKGGELAESSIEMIGEGRRLADRRDGERVSVVLLGSRAAESAEVPGRHGAHRVFWAQEERFDRYLPETFTAILAGLIGRYRPSVVLFSATDVGKDLAPRVAAKVRTSLSPHCDRLEWSAEGFLVQTRLTHGRKVHATTVCRNAAPGMATMEPGIAKPWKMPPGGETAPAEIVRIDPGTFAAHGTERIRGGGFLKADPRSVDIADAEIVVAGGKGACEGEDFGRIRDLAEALGAAVAGSRAAVDLGCIPRDRQIGQSGKTVSPELLISCGISGAHAHVAGIRDSRAIVAVNTDRHAPILKLADLAVVGDLREILPLLTDRLKKEGLAREGSPGS